MANVFASEVTVTEATVVRTTERPGDDLSQGLGNFISERRYDQGLTQTDLAEETGCSGASLSMYEGGHTTPPWSALRTILGSLGMSSLLIAYEQPGSPGVGSTSPK